MLLLILFGIFMIIGIVMVISSSLIVKYAKYGTWLRNNTGEINVSGWGIIAINIIILLCIGIVILCIQIPKETDYQNALYEKEVLEYRLENKDENLVGNEMLYSEITKFNNELRKHKTYSKNLWLNLFYNDKIATIDYIELNLRE